MWLLFPLLFLAGLVDGIAGGGGIISLSSYLAVGVPPHMALGTNKLTNFLGTGLSAAYFARKGHVKWDAALYAFAGALVGSFAGARLAIWVDERTLTMILLTVIPLVGALIIFRRDMGVKTRQLSPFQYIACAVLVGLVVGGYDGFIGPGAGTFLIVAFTLIMGFDMLTACGNAKVVNFASNLAAVGAFMASGHIDYRLGVPGAACAILGNYVGTHLAIKNGARIVRPMMIVVVVLLLGKVVVDWLRQGGG